MCFADDSSYTMSHRDPNILTQKIKSKYQEISKYMSNNRLILNTDKTHLLIMTSSYQHKRHQDFNITLDTGNEIIKPDQTELLLGGHISNDFTWKEHIRDNKKSIIKKLSSSINILIQVCKIANFKTRKMVANGIIMSQIIYLSLIHI